MSNDFAMQTPNISRRRQQRFLAALAENSDVATAAAEAQVDRAHLEQARKIDKAFADEWEAAERTAATKLEQEAWRRAVIGVPEPLVSEGKIVCDEDGRPVSVQRYSDSLLIEMMRINRSNSLRARKFGLGAPGSHLMKRPLFYLIAFITIATSSLVAFITIATGSLAFLWLHNHYSNLGTH